MNQDQYNALRALGYTGSLNEMERDFYKGGGAAAPALQDAENQYVVSLALSTGPTKDLWTKYLRAQGYTGSLDEMLRQFWINQTP